MQLLYWFITNTFLVSRNGTTQDTLILEQKLYGVKVEALEGLPKVERPGEVRRN